VALVLSLLFHWVTEETTLDGRGKVGLPTFPRLGRHFSTVFDFSASVSPDFLGGPVQKITDERATIHYLMRSAIDHGKLFIARCVSAPRAPVTSRLSIKGTVTV